MGTLKLIFDFKFPLPPSLFVIKKEPERGAAAADYKLEIHILATFKTLGGSQIILGRLSILLYLVWSVGLALYHVVLYTTIRNEAVFLLLRDFLFWGSSSSRKLEEGLMQSNIET